MYCRRFTTYIPSRNSSLQFCRSPCLIDWYESIFVSISNISNSDAHFTDLLRLRFSWILLFLSINGISDRYSVAHLSSNLFDWGANDDCFMLRKSLDQSSWWVLVQTYLMKRLCKVKQHFHTNLTNMKKKYLTYIFDCSNWLAPFICSRMLSMRKVCGVLCFPWLFNLGLAPVSPYKNSSTRSALAEKNIII